MQVIFTWTVFVLSLTVATCSRHTAAPVEVKLVFSAPLSMQATRGSRDPSSVTSMDCFLVNIRGPEVAPRYFPGQLSGITTPACLGLGAVSNTVSLATAQSPGVSVRVRPGPQRTIEVYGLYGAPNCGGKDLAQVLRESTPSLHLLGSTTQDITLDTSVTVANQFDPNTTSDKFSSCRLAPLRQFIGQGVAGSVHAISTVLDGSRDVLIGGDFTSAWPSGSSTLGRLARLQDDGQIVSSFTTNLNGSFNAAVLALQPYKNGKIFVGGSFSSLGAASYGSFLRINADGTADTILQNEGFDVSVTSFTLQPLTSVLYVGGFFNSYLIGGSSSSPSKVVALNADTLQPISGFTASHSVLDGVRTLELSLDRNSLYLGGTSSTEPRLEKIDAATGAQDFIFNTNTSALLSAGSVQAIRLAPDNSGDLYVGGAFQYNLAPSGNLIRVDASTGVKVTSFNPLGSGFNGMVTAIAPALDGTNDIYVAGQFFQYNGSPVKSVVRLTSTGALVTSFVIPTLNDSVNTLLAPIPRVGFFFTLYVGGDFFPPTASDLGGGILRFGPTGAIR